MKSSRNLKKFLLALTTGCMIAACTTNDNPSVTVPELVVQTTVGGTEQYYSGLTMQMGLAESSTPIASATIDAAGKATFSVDPRQFEGKAMWFGVERMVKFFHTLADMESVSGKLTLPDMEKGSTLDETRLRNDWIVALYMGVNKGGEATGAPLYWATGDLISYKTNGSGEPTQVAFHIATDEETIWEATETNDFVKTDERLVGNSDGYINMPQGTHWNLYCFGDKTGLCLYFGFDQLDKLLIATGQMKGDDIVYDISGNPNYDIATAALGGTWRMATGGKTGKNEFAAFEDNCEEYASLLPNGVTYGEEMNGFGVKFDHEIVIDGRKIVTNTLRFPAVGFRHGTESWDIGKSLFYWTGTADPTMTPIFGMEPGSYEPTPQMIAFNFGWVLQQFNWFAHSRMSGAAVRPVTE